MPNVGSAPSTALPWLRLTMNATQTMATSSTRLVSWDTVSASYAWPVPTAPVTNITIPYSGLVAIDVHDCDWGDTGAVAFNPGLYTRRNGNAATLRAAVLDNATNATTKVVQSFSKIMSFTAGEYLEIRVGHDYGSDLEVAIVEIWLRYIQMGTFPTTGTN